MKSLRKTSLCGALSAIFLVGVWYGQDRKSKAQLEAALPAGITLASPAEIALVPLGRILPKSWAEKCVWPALNLVGVRPPAPPDCFRLHTGNSGLSWEKYKDRRASLGEALAFLHAYAIDGRLYDAEGREIVIYCIHADRYSGNVTEGSTIVICVEEHR